MLVQITEKKSYSITKENARVLILQLNNVKPVETLETYEDYNQTFYTNTILQLKFPNNTIKVGDTIVVDNIKFKINEILVGKNNSYYLIDSELNKSAKYILPLVSENLSATNFLFKSCLYNTYLYYDTFPQYSDNKHLFVCFKYINNEVYKKMEKLLTSNKNFIDIIEPSKEETIFVFEVPHKYHYVVNDVLQGKYHYFDGYVKTKIISFFSPTLNNSMKYNSLYNSLKKVFERNEAEVNKLERSLDCKIPYHISIDSKPNINKETYKPAVL